MAYFPLIVLAGVLILTAVRQASGFRLHIWQIMLGGALLVTISGSIPLSKALKSVNPDVMLFLLGMFIVGEALVESGYLYHVSHGIFKRARTTDGLILMVLFVTGIFSAFLMNDTLAIIGTPLVLFFAERHRMPKKLMLLALCFATTLGSVMSPIGNPQNLLIAIGAGIENPFVSFLRRLAAPTLINLFIAYIFLKLFYGVHFHKDPLLSVRDDLKDPALASLAKVSLILLMLLVVAKIAFYFLFSGLDFRLTYIALVSAVPVLLSPKRFRILRRIDWHTLVFFASLFVLMESVWASGVLQGIMGWLNADLASTEAILLVSVLLSQILSNVPFVALYLPMLSHLGAPESGMLALAAGSTVAGNLLILGAASNVIVIQNAEKRGETLTFLEFARVGVPLTIVNMAVYWVFFRVMG